MDVQGGLLLLIFVLLFNQAFERYSISAHAQGLAYAFTASAYGIDAVRFNPAALSYLAKSQFSSGYEHTLSGIEGLHNICFGIARPIFNGGFGLQLSEFGFSEEKEQAITAAYGFGLSNDFKFGAGFDLYIINNRRTGNGFGYGLNIGLMGRLYKKWSLGVYTHNLNQPQFGKEAEGKLAPELRAGLGYEPFDGILSEVDLSIIDDDLRIHLAGEFKLFDILCLRSGIQTNPETVSFGAGILYKFIKFDYATEYIPELPLTHIFGINFEF